MTQSNVYLKDPDARVDFQTDWTDWLAGDTISASSWVVPSGITQYSTSNTTTTATIWLISGSEGRDYAVVNRITTTGGRINDQTLIIKVRSR